MIDFYLRNLNKTNFLQFDVNKHSNQSHVVPLALKEMNGSPLFKFKVRKMRIVTHCLNSKTAKYNDELTIKT